MVNKIVKKEVLKKKTSKVRGKHSRGASKGNKKSKLKKLITFLKKRK